MVINVTCGGNHSEETHRCEISYRRSAISNLKQLETPYNLKEIYAIQLRYFADKAKSSIIKYENDIDSNSHVLNFTPK